MYTNYQWRTKINQLKFCNCLHIYNTYHQGCDQIFGSSVDKMLSTTRYGLLLSCFQTVLSAV